MPASENNPKTVLESSCPALAGGINPAGANDTHALPPHPHAHPSVASLPQLSSHPREEKDSRPGPQRLPLLLRQKPESWGLLWAHSEARPGVRPGLQAHSAFHSLRDAGKSLGPHQVYFPSPLRERRNVLIEPLDPTDQMHLLK